MIVTSDIKDFPESVLGRYGIVAKRPDAFLLDFCESNAQELHGVIDDIAHTWGDPAGVVLAALSASAPQTAARLAER